MPEPRIVQVMREHKAALIAREEAMMQRMAEEWLRIEQKLKDDFITLATEAAYLRSSGQMINEAVIRRLERYVRLLWQVRAETGSYVGWVTDFVIEHQGEAAGMGLMNALEAIRTIYLEAGQIPVVFDVLNVQAIENLIGLAGDGSPLRLYFEKIHPGAIDAITQALVDGVVQGLNPRRVAQMMVDGLGMGLQQAMNTARTETLRAYREASLMQYRNSGVVSGYRRMSARDDRVCPGCLFTDGMLVEDLFSFYEHNQGRCTAVPVVIGAEGASEFENGTEWFLRQDEETQRSILGAGRYEAWQEGARLEDMATLEMDPTWGGAYVPTPVNGD